MFSPATIAPLAVMLGVILLMSGKSARHKEVASIIIGFGVLFIGIETMSASVEPLQDSEAFRSIFVTLGRNPLLGIFAGTFVTAIIQSSSASQGILLSLAASGLVPFNAAVYIIMGQNIGTCVTALISGIGATKTAKCVGYMHLMFNVIGTVVFSIIAVFYLTNINPAIGEGIITQTQISVIHTAFNIGTTIIVLPLSNYIIKAAMKINGVKENDCKDESQLVHLDKRMMETPSLAVEGAKLETIRLGQIALDNLQMASAALLEKDHTKIEEVKHREHVIDNVCDSISEYLIKLCALQISEKENQTVMSLLNAISDMERVGDHAENIAEIAEEMEKEDISFSQMAKAELKEMSHAAIASYQNALKALNDDNITYAMKTTVLEEQVDALEKQLRASHIDRLSNAECNVNSGIHFSELLGNLERISDHAMNIAQVVLNENREIKRYHDEMATEA